MLMPNSVTWLLLLLVSTGAGQPSPNAASVPCADLHMIVVRASREMPGYGIMGALAQVVLDNVNGSTSEAIDYPALLVPYDESSYAGVMATTKQLQSHVDRCPSGKVILMGYSQGAHVIGDVMCGGGVGPVTDLPLPSLGPPTPPVAAKYQENVVAMIQMGDPRFMPKKSYNVGTATHEGVSAMLDILL
ncbi:acetyl xylan esterase II precursor [Venturia nashicola]|uniref:Acetyl xylan esterase II n=1 Tax=Venturia nashicola TaxID=86259 RepID=A0A4Z1NZH2_9PEZI|nr:acetyl xylan esterase II precursor [Venturia nashicola]